MYENESGIVYAGDEKTIMLALQEIKEEADRRREQYEQQEDIRITLKEFGQSLKPVFVIVDIVQELHERLGGDDGKLDILADAAKSGIYVIATADVKLRPRNSEFLNMLAESKCGLIVGNIREQGIFSYTGLREENRRVDLGYYHEKGVNRKIKLITHE